MKQVAWDFSGFQTHSDRYRFGTETVRSWEGLQGGSGKKSNPRTRLQCGGSQTCLSPYPNQGSDYALLSSMVHSDRSIYRTTLWFWFHVTPIEWHITPGG